MECRRFIIESKDDGTCDCVDLLTGERDNYLGERTAALAAEKKMTKARTEGEPHMVFLYHNLKGDVVKVEGVRERS